MTFDRDSASPAQCMRRQIHDAMGDEKLRGLGEEQMQLEKDSKYKKKYATAWKVAKASIGCG